MITLQDEPCWTASPLLLDDYRYYPDQGQALAVAAPPPGGTLLATAVLASPCWTATCDHPGCGTLLPGPSGVPGAVAHAPDEAALRAWMAGGGWVHRPGGGAWCNSHHADQGILEAAAAITYHAGRFARISRAVVTVPGGGAETDSDHTVHLSWLAPALAAATEPGLDPDPVAAYAAVDDAVEVFAGDTPTITITITDQERARKHEREKAAQRSWHDVLDAQLPWLPDMIDRYESQTDPEARFVKAAGKLVPKLAHCMSRAFDLRGAGVTPGQFQDLVREQRAALGEYAGEFSALLGVYDQVTAAVCQNLAAMADGDAVGGQDRLPGGTD
jgi:5'-deoxynucleotidase YfbR-like HD superfamily hydrolase